MKKKSLDVFDFSEEDELAESASGKLLEKFANPSPSISPVLQRQRIQSLCQDKPDQKEEVEEGASCAEAATAVVDGHCEDAPALVTEAEDSTRDHLIESDVDHVNHGLAFGLSNDDHAKEAGVDDDNHGLMFGLNTEEHIKETEDHGLGSFSCQPSAESFYPEASSYSQPQLNSPLSDSSSSSEEQTDMMSAIDESLSDRSALSDDSDSEGDEDWMAERCLDDIEKIDRSTTVIMIPEYVVLKDMPSAASLVIFSCNDINHSSDHVVTLQIGLPNSVDDDSNTTSDHHQKVGVLSCGFSTLWQVEDVLFEPVRKTQDAMFFFKSPDGTWMPCAPKQSGVFHSDYNAGFSRKRARPKENYVSCESQIS
ncbi:probable ubiquitin-like-specific protease 2B isoform X2 [Raphanus sativus]|uniref:Probable ubiquitin-like-specific protease 2B isoform X2 n=1 Tax=Raphanus sativus TaxID=3726 RepID=A0A9W3DA55_RAPSA|nr:probable ubiquitin-like-specific protease 2B isoform X2 [Raphanus sativus]